MNKEDKKIFEAEDDLPPIFNSWNKSYTFVLGFFAILVFLFYLFTKAFE